MMTKADEAEVRAALRAAAVAGERLSVAAAVRTAEAARERGAIDVAYGTADSPFGPLVVAASRRGLVLLCYPGDDVDAELRRVAAVVSPRVVEAPLAVENVRRQLDEYFDGRRQRFDLPVDLALVAGFNRRVLEATARIPFGSVASYRDVATRAGSPRASRAAGNALAGNPIPIVVPCHRVVHSGGGLGGYTGGLHRKVTLLRLEGALEPNGRPPGSPDSGPR